MEFGSLGLGSPTPATQTVSANPARSATLETNPENVVTPLTQNDAAENELRRDGAEQNPDNAADSDTTSSDAPLTGRRTTLSFDTEQNRVFLEIVDTATDEVVERIPSEKFAALVEDSVSPPRDIDPREPDGSVPP